FQGRLLVAERGELRLLIDGGTRPRQLAPLFLDDALELGKRFAHLPQSRQLHLEIEILGEQETAKVLEFRQQLADLGLGLAQLSLAKQLLRFLHLLEYQLFPRKLEGQT